MSKHPVNFGCLLTAAFVAYGGSYLRGGDCWDPEGLCPEPCLAQNSCTGPFGSSENCPGDMICIPSCLPSWCYCSTQYEPSWACSADCAGECYQWPEPTGPPTHTITELPTLGGLEGQAYGINNYGDVVGWSGALDGRRHATLCADGEAIDIGPPDVSSWAEDINDVGQVLVARTYHVWLWQEDTGLNELAEFIRAFAINDAGQVVGSATSSACLWEDGVITDLYDTVGIAGAHDINNLGHVAGEVKVGTEWHAAIWNGDDVVCLGTLGGQRSSSDSINDLGQVIGESERAPGGDRVFYGFFWDGEQMHDAADLVGYDSWAFELNNCGEVLLEGTRRNEVGFYVYETHRGLLPVRGVLGPATGWWNLSARGMNDRGEIIGMGTAPDGFARGFLIAPVPGDLDWDGDADLRDFAEFALRFTGAKIPAIPGCERADMDRDADLDLKDFALFLEAASGPRLPRAAAG